MKKAGEVDDKTEIKPAPWHLIRRNAASKRSAVNQYQVKLLGRLTNNLEQAVLKKFRVSAPEFIPVERFQEILDVDEYCIFIEGMFACGFVCTDEKSEGNLDAVNRDPKGIIRRMISRLSDSICITFKEVKSGLMDSLAQFLKPLRAAH